MSSSHLFQDANSDKAKAFTDAAAGIDDVPFGITSHEEAFKEYEAAEDAVLMIRKVRTSAENRYKF